MTRDDDQGQAASPSRNWRVLGRFAAAATVVLLLALALLVLRRELGKTPPEAIWQAAQAIPVTRIVLACALTGLSYFVLTWYDFFGLRYASHPLPYKKSAAASFIAYVFSHNIGFAELSGTALRFHMYTSWGIDAVSIAKAAVFGMVTYWLGLGMMGTLAFTLAPPKANLLGAVPPIAYQALGCLLFLLVLSYILAVLRLQKVLRIRGYEFALPSPRLGLIQLGLALADWLSSSSVLYAVLQSVTGLPYLDFLGLYILAMTAGSISHVPGGIGVMESVFVLALKGQVPAGSILGAFLVYRAIYYLLPLIPGITLLLALELNRLGSYFLRFARWGQPWFAALAPNLFAFLTFLSGLILLISGATPEEWSRLRMVEALLPLASIEVSHLLASIIGVALLITARGLQQKLDGAYIMTLFFLGAGAVLSLLKGFDYEEATLLMLALLVLLPCRSFFYRKSSLLEARFSPAWIAAILSTVMASAWLALLSHQNLAYSQELWWHFSTQSTASRSFRASLAAALTLTLAGLAWLLHPSHPGHRFQRRLDDTIRRIMKNSSRTVANLALSGDKEFLLNPAGTAFIMFARRGRHWIAMGDPIGPDTEMAEMIWQFQSVCDAYAARPVFYEVDAAGLHHYIDAGFSVIKIGEEAIIPLASFHIEGHKFKDLRNARHHMEGAGIKFEIIAVQDVPALLADLQSISDAWLAKHKAREKAFSVGAFKPDYLCQSPIAIMRGPKGIEAFANLWLTQDKTELSIDLMRYRPTAPHGIMDGLLCEIILWGKNQGFRSFNLGMAPLAGLDAHSMPQPWAQLGTLVYQHGEHFYNFRGLRAYKNKWHPEWQPKYLASPAGAAWASALVSLAALIGRTQKEERRKH